MLIYHYDSDDGQYKGSSMARMSPLEPDVPLVPANATLAAPPEPQEGYVRAFKQGAWILVEETVDLCWTWPCLAFQEHINSIAEGLEYSLEEGIHAQNAYSPAMLSIRNRLLGAHEVVTGPPDSMEQGYLETLTAIDGLVAIGLLTEEQKTEAMVAYEG